MDYMYNNTLPFGNFVTVSSSTTIKIYILLIFIIAAYI